MSGNADENLDEEFPKVMSALNDLKKVLDDRLIVFECKNCTARQKFDKKWAGLAVSGHLLCPICESGDLKPVTGLRGHEKKRNKRNASEASLEPNPVDQPDITGDLP